MAASQFRALKGGGIDEVLFGENECVLRYFHAMIAEHLARWSDFYEQLEQRSVS